MKLSGTITKVSGPLVVANGLADANVSDVVRVGEQRLIGEILNMTGDSASIQVYEETSGLGPGAKVETTGMPLSVELGPGMLENIYDGIQRPLPEIRDLTGSNITRGIEVPALNRERVWHFDPVVQPGTAVTGGDVIGTVQETTAILHKIMVPPQMKGTIKSITGGDFTVDQTVAVLTDANGVDHELNMIQRWPVRIARPYAQKFAPNKPMNSGQRIIDTLFPIAKGGTAAVPGPFGSGKTVVQHQLAKWSDVDVVVYIGCGERGNEMTDVLMEFPELTEPVSQATMRIVKVFWALDSSLAYARHFPAINWLTSYSLYVDSLKPWYEATFGEEYMANRDKAMSILQQESELQEIVRLVGQDALSPADRLTMETAKMIREDFLQQNAFVDIDSYSEYRRQFLLLGLILRYDAECRDALEKNAPMHKLFAIPARVDIGRAKSVPSDEYEQVYAKIAADMTAQIKEIIAGGEEQ